MAQSKWVKANEEIARKAVETFEKVEEAIIGGYAKVEDAVVGGYTKVEDAFVEHCLTRDGETAAKAKARLKKESERRSGGIPQQRT